MNYNSSSGLSVKKFSSGAATSAGIILHGYGANNDDLFSLGENFNHLLKKNIDWYFPEGPLDLSMSPYFRSRAWFPIDLEAMQRSIATGEPRFLADRLPPGLFDARDLVMKLVNEIFPLYDKVLIGGFSQGAMLSTECLLNFSEKFCAGLLLSGNLLCQERWQDLAKNAHRLKIFQSHGMSDAILSFSGATDLEKLLLKAGHQVSFMKFSGAHEIPFEVLKSAGMFLHEILS